MRASVMRQVWRRTAPRCVALLLAVLPALATAQQAEKLYQQHCASCHGAERLGAMGPALLPENLERLHRAAAVKVIADGLIATRMPGFGGKLAAAEIEALAGYINTPPAVRPQWGIDEIKASRIEYVRSGTLGDKPRFAADPLNLFVVVETGDHHVTILDGDRFEPLARFASRYALHGRPQFSPEGRYVYFASRDGWISKYDLYKLETVAEVRAGISTRNAAVSGDGRYVMVANYLPHTLVVLDARGLVPLKVIAAQDAKGKTSRVSAVYDAAPRKSFVAALKDIPEVWEVSYDENAPPIYGGLVHDYRMGEAVATRGYLNPRRTLLDEYLDDFLFDPSYAYVIGAARDGGKGQVVNLDVRRRIAEVPLPGLPHLGSGITWQWQGRTVLATPNLREGVVSVIDVKTWQPVKQIATNGPGFFMRSHEHTRYAWVDAFNSARRDTLQIIDKDKLEIVASVTPAPGRTAAHVEFTRDGRYALVSVWEMDGALMVYDTQTLKEVKRLPMKRPAGKYNVYNEITRSKGTTQEKVN